MSIPDTTKVKYHEVKCQSNKKAVTKEVFKTSEKWIEPYYLILLYITIDCYLLTNF